MKRILTIVSSIVLITFFSTGQGQARTFIKGFSLKLNAGYGFIAVGDLNTVSENWINNNLESWNPILAEGEFNKFNPGLEFGGELILNLTDHFRVGMGVEQILRNKNSLIWMYKTYVSGSLMPMYMTYYDEAKLSALAVKLNAYYFFPISWANIYVNVGMGYYFGKIHNVHRDNLFWDDIIDLGIWGTSLIHQQISHSYEIDAKDNAIGFHGGIGFEFIVTGNIFLFFEGIGRYVKLKDWEGEEAEWPKQGTLYYVEFSNGETNFYIWEDKPSFGSFSRKTVIDFSGVSFRAGIKIKF